MRKLTLVFLAMIVGAGLAFLYFRNEAIKEEQLNTTTEVVAKDLMIPWEIAFLPDGDMLVSERSGDVKRIGANEQTYTVQGVEHIGEGGLLGLALHPDFERNHWLYLYLTTRADGSLINRVDSYRYSEDRLTDKTTIINNIPGAVNHDGGRLAFGPDGFLYITTGDAGRSELAQNKNSLAGKILRLTDGGQIPADNPFGNAAYSYGHRNPQGLAWDDKGRLWATEHGQSALDEVNLIKRGANYGWPEIEGDESRSGMVQPVVHSGPDTTWAPGGMAFADGKLFFVGLAGEALYEAEIKFDDSVSIKTHYHGDFGRLRAVKLGPDGTLYISTSNTDGRGDVRTGDDKIIRLDLSLFRDR